MSLGARIRRLRSQHQPPLSQAALAKQAKRHRNTIQRLEAGRLTCEVATAAAIANALGITVSELLNEDPQAQCA